MAEATTSALRAGEHAVLWRCKHNIIRNPWFHFGNILPCMTVLSQAVHDLAIYALVGEKVHATVSATG